MQGGGGIGEGQGQDGGRMEVWDSRAECGAGGWGRSQDECPSEAIYSSPSWATLPGPDHHQYYPYFPSAHIKLISRKKQKHIYL